MEAYTLANERAASVSFVEFKVAQASASNLYHWGFETPAAIAIVDELSRKAAYLLEKRVFFSVLGGSAGGEPLESLAKAR